MMTSGSAIAGFAGTILLLAGLALLVLAWRRRRQARGLLIAGGWALIALSLWPWVIFGGPDRGLAVAVCVLTLAAFAVVMRNGAAADRGRAEQRDDADIAAGPDAMGMIPWGRHAWVALLAGPIAFASAMALSLVVFMSHGLAEADRITLAGLLIPTAWGALATWALSDPKLLRKSVAVVGTGVVGGLMVAVLAAVQ